MANEPLTVDKNICNSLQSKTIFNTDPLWQGIYEEKVIAHFAI